MSTPKARTFYHIAHPIKTLDQFWRVLQKRCDHDNVIFRGQREAWPMLPKLARLRVAQNALQAERLMLEDFRRASTGLVSQLPNSDWDWLAVAQHAGLATRLLDWTSNPLAALWFAVRKPSTDSKSAVVWAFRSQITDYVDPRTHASPFAIKRTKVFRPSSLSARIVAQNGWFTVHTPVKDKERFIPFETNRFYKQRLLKITVVPTAFQGIRWQLDRCGINSASMFADLDGVAEHATWQHSYLRDEQ